MPEILFSLEPGSIKEASILFRLELNITLISTQNLVWSDAHKIKAASISPAKSSLVQVDHQSHLLTDSEQF